MLDSWENQYGFLSKNPDDASADADNDGFTNLQELNGFSNPRDPKSTLNSSEYDDDNFFSTNICCWSISIASVILMIIIIAIVIIKKKDSW